jgi:transcription initiation factor TFIIIB Brf1 subunit/transcription initiation factor TFIIB
MKVLICANCGRNFFIGFIDKVSNKKVCDTCKNVSIELGIRFDFDFERFSHEE